MMYFGSLKYSNFFKMNSKTDKDFSCPSKIYLNYDLTKAPMGYYLEQTCDEDLIGAQCNIAEASKGKQVFTDGCISATAISCIMGCSTMVLPVFG